MAKRNGKQKTPNKTPTHKVPAMPPLVPQPNGKGAIYQGGIPGNKGGTGRPRSEVRAAALEGADIAIPKLIAIVRDVKSDKNEVTAAAKVLLQFGLGTTTTETDTEGRDVQVRVIREQIARHLDVDWDSNGPQNGHN